MTDGAQARVATPALAPAQEPTATEELVWIGSDQPSVLAAGHSNRSALQVAISAGLDPGIGAVLTTSGPRLGITPAETYWQELMRADPVLPVAILYNGNAYNVGFLIEGTPFTFVHPLEPRRVPRQVVPLEAVRERLDTLGGGRDSNGLDWVLERLRGRQVVLVAPPPPKSDELVRQGLARESHFVNLLQQLGRDVDTAPITRLSMRMALRAVMCETYAEVAARHGVGVLQTPAEAVNDDGSLKPEYSRFDATHANEAYGALVWRQLADYFDIRATS